MKFIAVLLLTLSTAHAACELSFPQTNICGDVVWTEGPHYNRASSFTVTFDQNIAPNSLKLDLWMPTMGHGSRPLVLRASSETEVMVSGAWFVMRGLWQIRAKLVDPSGTLVDSTLMELSL
jgi:hypothetical protein